MFNNVNNQIGITFLTIGFIYNKHTSYYNKHYLNEYQYKPDLLQIDIGYDIHAYMNEPIIVIDVGHAIDSDKQLISY